MSTAPRRLEAGGLLPIKTKVDANATEQLVARTYRHPALGDRPVVRLAAERLGQAEDLAMEFLGFAPPAVSAPIAIQQRRSLGFAAWALTNDPANARFALDLVKRMKAAARQARSKPGHAWDAYTEMAKDLGRSVRHFLPPFWEEAGRAFKELGNTSYASRALNKSLEAERVHALESDRARRRDVVLEFVLSGCLSGTALSEYGNDLLSHAAPAEAFAIFRDLCLRRTLGGMPPWSAFPKDFTKLAKAADLDANAQLEQWLEEAIEAPAMGRASQQFWKACSPQCQRIVARSPAFAVALLRHTKPQTRYYGESPLGPWFDLLEEWGVLAYLWEDQHNAAPPLGEPIAVWFSRIVCDASPAPRRTLEMLEKLAPRLRKEKTPLALCAGRGYWQSSIDIDMLEACLRMGVTVDDPPHQFDVTFDGWLMTEPDHPLRNQDIVESSKDARFLPAIAKALDAALACRGGALRRGYLQTDLEQRPFPVAAADRPGIVALWRTRAAHSIEAIERCGLASFEAVRGQLETTLWPDTLRLFPDLAERLNAVDAAEMLRTTLQAGVFDEYGWPALEKVVEENRIELKADQYEGSNLHPSFPSIVWNDAVHAHVIRSDGTIQKHELRVPKKSTIHNIIVVGDDLAVSYRDEKYQNHLHWVSDPSQRFEIQYSYHRSNPRATVLKDGSVFFGDHAVRPGDKQMPSAQPYFHDGQRFWQCSGSIDPATHEYRIRVHEVDPHTGKPVRESVPPWFEETEGGEVRFPLSELIPAPEGAENSPLGSKDGMLGWKVVKRRDGSTFGQGIDGRRWDKPLGDGPEFAQPAALLNRPGSEDYLPVTGMDGRSGSYCLWDPTGSTVVAQLQDFRPDFAYGQPALLPLEFWHLLKVRDGASSKTLRTISVEQCARLFEEAAKDRQEVGRMPGKKPAVSALNHLLPAVKALLPTAPERMAMGIARLIERAEKESAAFAALRERMLADAKKDTKAATQVVYRKSDQGAEHWGLTAFHYYRDESTYSVSANLTAAAEFLKGDSPGGALPPTKILWFAMLDGLPLRCWQTCWRAHAAKLKLKGVELPWLEFLRLWQAAGLADLPGQFDLMDGYPQGLKKSQWGRFELEVEDGTSFTLQNGDDKFIVAASHSFHQTESPYHFLRYSTSRSPGPPPGYEVKHVRRIATRSDATDIAAFIAAAEACEAPPLPTREELADLARKLSASPAELGLIWMGGLNLESYEHNFLPTELRTALGLKTSDAAAARQALKNMNESALAHLYASVVAPGCAAPFAADRTPVLRSIEKAWQARMPQRLQLEASLQKRLSAIGKTYRWQRVNHEELLAAAADPANHSALQPTDLEIRETRDREFGGVSLKLVGKGRTAKANQDEILSSIVDLVGLIHAETPAGHPARAAMPALIQQTNRILEHPGTLLELRHVTIYEPRVAIKPSDWFSKHIGKLGARDEDGVARYDDGLIAGAALDDHHSVFVAFRPAQLRNEGDLARLLGIMAIELQDYLTTSGLVPTVAVLKSQGFQKLAKAIVADNVPAGQWPQNPHLTAPAVVEAIQKKHKLSDDAAVLYTQILALPDPTSANICAWNGWTSARLKKAAAELVATKLVLEATRARAGRSVFLPGEWSELKAPWLPIETWKLAHLVELEGKLPDACPAGGPMVLRPFEDVFTAAWQRVVDGDIPRYEQAKRKKKSK